MTKRRSSAIRITGPRVRVTPRGIRVAKPRARVGRRTGVNVSASGVSLSTRTKAGTFNTKHGFTSRSLLPGCTVPALVLALILAATLACGTSGDSGDSKRSVAVATQRPTFTAEATRALPQAPTSAPASTTAPTDTAPPPSATPAPTNPPTAPPTDTAAPPTSTTEPPTAAPTNTTAPPSPQPTATPAAPTQTLTPAPPAPARLVIIAVNKREEWVDIRNEGGQPQDLAGWVLLSEKGSQSCPLAGSIAPGATLRVWAQSSDAPNGGYNCGFGTTIWNNEDPDPAVLLDAQGREVSRR